MVIEIAIAPLEFYYCIGMTVTRLSTFLAPTLRDDPSDAELPSHRLLVRAGYIRAVGAGIFSLLPLGLRTIKRIESILREEMNKVGGQEVLLPIAQPAELWRESGRWEEVGDEMLRFKDRAEREMCLAMTHEEAIVHLVRNDVTSYRQLPVLLYQIQTKFRDEPRSRGGLIRVREFTMKDAYSFHEDQESLEEWYKMLYAAYERIFRRSGIDFEIVESDPGMMGGKTAHEFMAPSEFGEDTLIKCPSCGYSANRQVARFRRDEAEETEMLEAEDVATPDKESIEDVAGFLGIEPSRTAKAVFFYGEEHGLIFALLRGDYEINETALMKACGERELRPALDDEIRRTGAVPGYASPTGVEKAFVVIDPSVEGMRNFVSGANKEGFHRRNVNVGRDFTPDHVAEIAAASAGAACVECGASLTEIRGIEIGNIFQLGTRYSASMGATFQDRSGTDQPFIMGCYGIGSGRLMASIVEQNHDKDGIIWPGNVSPFDVLIVPVGKEIHESTYKIAEELSAKNLEVLLDDRDLRAGVKFKDADLLGIPFRVTVGKKAEDGIVEFKERRGGEVHEIEMGRIAETVAEAVRASRKTKGLEN